MKGFLLDEKQRDELAGLNAGRADRQLAPVPLKDGRWVISADALDDGYWKPWQEFLKGLGEPVDVAPEDSLCATSIEDVVSQNALKAAYQSEAARVEGRGTRDEGQINADSEPI
jgi:hypothetical protein